METDLAGREPKPEAFVRLASVVPRAFEILKNQYNVSDEFVIDLSSVVVKQPEIFSNPVEIAPITMRKLQMLMYLASSPAVTTNMIVFPLLIDIHRSFDQLKTTASKEVHDAIEWFISYLQEAVKEIGGLFGGDDYSIGDTIELV